MQDTTIIILIICFVIAVAAIVYVVVKRRLIKNSFQIIRYADSPDQQGMTRKPITKYESTPDGKPPAGAVPCKTISIIGFYYTKQPTLLYDRYGERKVRLSDFQADYNNLVYYMGFCTEAIEKDVHGNSFMYLATTDDVQPSIYLREHDTGPDMCSSGKELTVTPLGWEPHQNRYIWQFAY
jgi:hypothetical protein